MAINSRQQLISEVAEALDMRFDEGCFYLNLTEQEIGPNCPAEYVGEENSWPRDGDEVVRIEPLSSDEAYAAMEEFADRLQLSVSDRLFHALGGRHPFSRFKETLYSVGPLVLPRCSLPERL